MVDNLVLDAVQLGRGRYEKDLIIVFLSRLPPRIGAGNAVVGKFADIFRQRFSPVVSTDALSDNRAVRQEDRNSRVMRSAAFIARNNDAIAERRATRTRSYFTFNAKFH